MQMTRDSVEYHADPTAGPAGAAPAGPGTSRAEEGVLR
jgi:hypothetical protein